MHKVWYDLKISNKKAKIKLYICNLQIYKIHLFTMDVTEDLYTNRKCYNLKIELFINFLPYILH